MKNSFGQNVQITLFGESHGPYIGAVLDGLTPGLEVDKAFIEAKPAMLIARNAASVPPVIITSASSRTIA